MNHPAPLQLKAPNQGPVGGTNLSLRHPLLVEVDLGPGLHLREVDHAHVPHQGGAGLALRDVLDLVHALLCEGHVLEVPSGEAGQEHLSGGVGHVPVHLPDGVDPVHLRGVVGLVPELPKGMDGLEAEIVGDGVGQGHHQEEGGHVQEHQEEAGLDQELHRGEQGPAPEHNPEEADLELGPLPGEEDQVLPQEERNP